VSDVWSLPIAIAVFAAASVITIAGSTRLASLGDVLADRLRLGEAIFGAVLFGGVTSISGIVMTGTAAVAGQAGLAYGNAVGGIAAQTVALAIVDLTYRKANLEHAAASLPNLMFGLLLVAMLSLALLIGVAPNWTIFGVHPGCALMLAGYLYGLRLVRQVRNDPAWRAKQSAFTREDVPESDTLARSTGALLVRFLVIGAIVSASGWGIAHAASAFLAHTAVSETVVGVLWMGIVNAAPETITAIAAVRRGALTLAIAGILGGNAFDVLNLVVGDVLYRRGSLFHAAAPEQSFVTVLSVLLTVIVLMGLVRRQTHGIAGIGWESILLSSLYIGGMLVLILRG
jgi:cation:H+ antiporter